MGKDARKPAKLKVPKQVGGVTLPKKLRKAGKKVLKVAQQPVVSEAVAAALLAAAAALREQPSAKGAAKAAGDAGAEAAGEVSRLVEGLRAFAIDMARRTLDSWEANGRSGKNRG